MISILKAEEHDAELLSEIAAQSFLESHGNAAEPEDLNTYIADKYNEAVLKEELRDPANIYHILYYDGRAAGYSNIVFNSPYPGSEKVNLTKLDRIYLLQDFYHLKLGRQLLDFNIELAKQNGQAGMWLYTWIENARAIGFYIKNGFVINGSYDFRVSERKSNPNHRMLLVF